MKQVKYFCNLCGEEKSQINELKTLWWNSGKLPQGYELTSDKDAAHKHICWDCIDVVRELDQVNPTRHA